MRSSVVTPSCGFRDELPALAEQRGLDAVGVGHEGFHVGLEMKEDELFVELETQGVTERRLDYNAAEILSRAVEAPEDDGRRRS